MRNQDTLLVAIEDDMGLDQITAASYIRGDLGRQVAHAGMKYIALAPAVETTCIVDEPRSKSVIEREHLVLLCFIQPLPHQRGQLVGAFGCKVVGFGKILVEMIELPSVVLIGCAGRMEGDRLPARVP